MKPGTLAAAVARILGKRCPRGVAPNVARFAAAHALVRATLYRVPKYGYKPSTITAVALALGVPESEVKALVEVRK